MQFQCYTAAPVSWPYNVCFSVLFCVVIGRAEKSCSLTQIYPYYIKPDIYGNPMEVYPPCDEDGTVLPVTVKLMEYNGVTYAVKTLNKEKVEPHTVSQLHRLLCLCTCARHVPHA